MPFSAFVFTLCSKVELNWTRAIRPVIAQTVQFSKIAKKLNIDAYGIAKNLTLMYSLSTEVPEKCLLVPLFLLYAPK